MKKLLPSLLAFFCLFGSPVIAQTNIASYSLTVGTSTYTPITGGTVVVSGSYDNTVSSAVSLGGTFTFGGTAFSTCYISSNGFIAFGGAPTGTNYTPLSTLGSSTGVVSAFGQDAGGSTVSGATPEVSYLNIGGSTGEFVVQYTDHANWYNRSVERLNFQIRLNLATNVITIVYGNCTNPGSASTSGTSVQVGIRGNSTTYATNVNNLMIGNNPSGTTCDWSSAVTGFANNSNLLFAGSTNVNVKIPNGLTLTYTPQSTVAPVRTFSAVSGVTATDATISWTAPTGATQYNIQYRPVGSCTWTNFSGNPTSSNSATLTGLTPYTAYQVRVQATDGTNNTIWSHIPDSVGTGNGYTSRTFITQNVPCAGAPAPGNTIASVDSVCSGVNFTLSLQNQTIGSGVSYQWESSPDGFNFSPVVSGGTSTTYTTSQTATTYYRAIVTCANGASSTPSTPVMVEMHPFYNCYCTPISACVNEGIDSVSIDAFSNTSGFCVNSNGYTDYTGMGSTASVNQGGILPIVVKAHINSNPASAGVWIDYNQNSQFEASEYTSLGSASVSIPTGGTTYFFSGNINVPLSALTGLTRMRIRTANQNGITNTSSCITSSAYGEFEDYLVTITQAPSCGTIVTAGTVATSITTVSCPGLPVILSATGFTSGVTNLSYQWQESQDGFTFTNIGIATSSYKDDTVLSTSQTMYYRLHVTCAAGGAFDYSPPAQVSYGTAQLPWSEDFEGLTSTGANILPSCWSSQILAGTNNPGSTNDNSIRRSPRSGTKYLYTQWSSTAWIYTPPFDLQANTSYTLSFYMMNKSISSPVDFVMDVAYGDSASATAMTNVLQSGYSPTNTSYQLFSYTFTPTATGTYYFGIKSTSTTTSPWYLSFDDFTLELTPSCMPPTLKAASNVGTSSATINWSPSVSNPSVGYEYYYSTSNTPPTTATGTVTANDSSVVLTGLSSSTTYYYWVRSDCSSNSYSSWVGGTFATLLGNDLPEGAIPLAVSAGCTTPIYTNAGASYAPGEPAISCRGTNINSGSIVWFKFIAPASGFVRVSTDIAGGFDTKLGLFGTMNPSDSTDLSSFYIIGCDDDNGITVGTSSTLYASGLTPGVTYYVGVDHYNGTTTGSFCVKVDSVTQAMIAPGSGSCVAFTETPYSREDYTGWATIVDGQGRLIANVRRTAPSGSSSVYNYSGALTVNTAGLRNFDGKVYLDRNFSLNYSQSSAPTTFDLKLYFLNTELAALQVAEPTRTLADLNVIRQAGTSCANNFNLTANTNSVLQQSANGTANGVSWIQVNTPGFSNFYIASGLNPLVIKLADIHATNAGNRNRVHWTTESELKSDRFELERSVDGRNFVKIADFNANGEASTYSYWDETPVRGINYYRLKMIDASGKSDYSEVVTATVKGDGSFNVIAYPNPVKNKLTLIAYGTKAQTAIVTISDLTGKVVKTENMIQGFVEINMEGLAQGLYLVKYSDGTHTHTTRVTKD